MEYGDVICDAHDGIDLKRLGDGAKVSSRVSLCTRHGAEFIEKVVGERIGAEYKYTNKHLVIVGESSAGLVLAYSYDDRTVEFISVEMTNRSRGSKCYTNLVPRDMRGRTFKKCRFEVLSYCSETHYNDSDERLVDLYIVAKFSCYGDATKYANELANSPETPFVIIRA